MIINSNVIGIIADDLTGANDSALQFQMKGANTQILLRDDIEPSNIDNSQIWAISTETRNVTPHDAYEQVKHTTKMFLKVLKPDYLFKKIDSTVRGNIAVEVLGILESLNWDAVVVVPAFPLEGRITVGGYHLLNGIPIERTEMARDPHSPIFESHLPTLLKSQLPEELHSLIETIDLSTVMKGAGPILKRINELIKDGKKLIIADAISTTDIEQIVLSITKSEYKILPAGNAACAKALSNIWVTDEFEDTNNDINSKLPKLIVSGSATQITAKQIDKLEQSNFANTHIINLEMLQVLDGVKDSLAQDIINKLQQGQNVVIHTSALFRNFTPENESLRAELTKADLAGIITDYLAELTRKIIEQQEVILITLGGETSYKCCSEINSYQLELIDEVAPAIALSRDNNGQLIVTKSGNLGNEDTLINILNYFEK